MDLSRDHLIRPLHALSDSPGHDGLKSTGSSYHACRRHASRLIDKAAASKRGPRNADLPDSIRERGQKADERTVSLRHESELVDIPYGDPLRGDIGEEGVVSLRLIAAVTIGSSWPFEDCGVWRCAQACLALLCLSLIHI
eukprot:2502952-Prymnesium_polylepis.2